MAEYTDCSNTNSTDHIAKVYNYPVLQHSAKSDLFFAERNNQKTITCEQFTSSEEYHSQSSREDACSQKLAYRCQRNRYSGCSRSNASKCDKDSGQYSKNEHLGDRSVYLPLSDSNIIVSNFFW